MADDTAPNQSPLYGDINLFTTDMALNEAVAARGAGARASALAAFGERIGACEFFDLGRLANQNLPVLHRFDPRGEAINRIEYHPAYHRLMEMSTAHGLHCAGWELNAGPEDFIARAAGFYMMAQVETGHLCPITMTHAAMPALMADPAEAEQWRDRITNRSYDPRHVPANEKFAVTFAMALTERQGGTDLRTNTTRAEPVSGEDEFTHRLSGEKWFFSAPMSDVFLVLAQAPGGLSCFVVPRLLAGGADNGMALQRLKYKLGNRSNASCEVVFENALGRLLGEEGRGVRTIIEMATTTRLDCAIATAGLMRAGLARALHHTRARAVFGAPLASHPLMVQTLADLALENEGALALVMRLAGAFSRPADAGEVAFKRCLTPVVKYWVCKRGPQVLAEAMEALGGNGYVEDWDLARAYREVPVNSIWEGSGNVMCLDFLRAFDAGKEQFAHAIDNALGTDKNARKFRDTLVKCLGQPDSREARARWAVEQTALRFAANLLRNTAPTAVAEGFEATRIAAMGGTFGAGLAPIKTAEILQRALPERALPEIEVS
ncbi:MAG: acyl-CoA dehydrogenase family protein [Alphaproteobacteria bacterium]